VPVLLRGFGRPLHPPCVPGGGLLLAVPEVEACCPGSCCRQCGAVVQGRRLAGDVLAAKWGAGCWRLLAVCCAGHMAGQVWGWKLGCCQQQDS
jgi:hypothetical protein